MDNQLEFTIDNKSNNLPLVQGRDFVDQVTEGQLDEYTKTYLRGYTEKFSTSLGKQVGETHSEGYKSHQLRTYTFKIHVLPNVWIKFNECEDCKEIRNKTLTYFPSFGEKRQDCYEREFIKSGTRLNQSN